METQEQGQQSTSVQTHDLDYVYMDNESSWCRIRLHGTELLTSDYETVAYHLADGRVAVLAENPEDTSTLRLHIHDGDEPLRDWLLQWFERGDVQEIEKRTGIDPEPFVVGAPEDAA